MSSQGRSGARESQRRLSEIEHPVAALTMMIGFACAIYAIPADVEPRDALRLPALLGIVAVCLVPALSILRSPKSIFRAEHVLIMSPAYWLLLDPLQGRLDVSGVDREWVVRSFVAIAAFVAGASLAFLQRPWRAPAFITSTATMKLPTQFYFSIGLLAFALAFLKYAIPSGFDLVAMAQSLMTGRWEGTWGRGSLGGVDAFADHLGYFGYLLPPLTVILARRLGWANIRPVCLAVGTMIIATFILHDGGRRLVGTLFGSGLVFGFLAASKVRLSTVLCVAFVVVALWLTLEGMLTYRGVGVISAIFDEQAKVEEDDSGALVRVDDNFLRLAQLTSIFPDLHEYTTWRYGLWVAVRPVPRLFWPNKPLNPGFDLPEFLGKKGVSLSASVIGELFMAGGFAAVAFGGWFYGRLARSLWHFLLVTRTPSGLLIYSIGLFAIFIGMRLMIELVLMSYVILAWVLLVRTYDGFRSR